MPNVVGNTVLTLVDIAKGWGAEGAAMAQIVEILNVSNQILTDMRFKEGNLPTGELTIVRTGLPTVTWRRLNNGVTPSKSLKEQITEQCGMLEAWSEVDTAVAELNGNVAQVRLSEARAFLEAMNQEMASVLFYGNSGLNPEKFTGVSPRYASLSAGNSQNIIDGGGTGSDNTSVWLIVWGENTVMGIYPKGSQAGLQHQDFGEQTIQSSTSGGIGTGRMRAYQERFVWKSGIALKDWRFCVRIANIDVSNLVAESTPTDLTNKLLRAIARIPNDGMGQSCIYMNRTVFEMLTIQRFENVRTGGQLNYGVVDGVISASFMGIPVRRTDALLNTESRVT